MQNATDEPMKTERVRGVVEGVSRIGLQGWVSPVDGVDRPVRVIVRIGGEDEATILARLPRDDIRNAGLSVSGRCGFEYVFQRPVGREMVSDVVVVAEDSGEALPHVDGPGPNLFDRVFVGNTHPESAFLSPQYIRHNARRLEHLASLGLPLRGRSVVEFGAGVGDHTTFYLDRGCSVLATDARPGNLALLRRRLSEHPAFGRLETAVVDVDQPFPAPGLFDVAHCYGLLYHLANPVAAIAAMAASCAELFLLESKTDPGEQEVSSAGDENRAEVFHSYSGRNFRPTRAWIAAELRRHFPHVYFPLTCPAHEEFPANWGDLAQVPDGWPRTTIVASRRPLGTLFLADRPPLVMNPV
jgi:hypothetical protein